MVRPKFVKAAVKDGEVVERISYGSNQSEDMLGQYADTDTGDSAQSGIARFGQTRRKQTVCRSRQDGYGADFTRCRRL